VSDYLRELHRLSGELLLLHGGLLKNKNIHRRGDLARAIRLDLDKLAEALIEVGDTSAPEVLGRFFEGDCPGIRGWLGSDRIYHVGLEIQEPLALVLDSIRLWGERENADMRLRDFLRFPASEAFQRCVAAPAEIMRIWLEVNGRTLMRELFDIFRPTDPPLAAAPRPFIAASRTLLVPPARTRQISGGLLFFSRPTKSGTTRYMPLRRRM